MLFPRNKNKTKNCNGGLCVSLTLDYYLINTNISQLFLNLGILDNAQNKFERERNFFFIRQICMFHFKLLNFKTPRPNLLGSHIRSRGARATKKQPRGGGNEGMRKTLFNLSLYHGKHTHTPPSPRFILSASLRPTLFFPPLLTRDQKKPTSSSLTQNLI